MVNALVIGGTGPSGSGIVAGLLARGYQVSILHTGQHEVSLPGDVEHIHTDPHFTETLTESLAGREFDVVMATYGRVRLIAQVLAHRMGRFITISGASYAGPTDPRWGPLGIPMVVSESLPVPQDWQDDRAMAFKVWKTEQALLEMHAAGAFSLTTIRYPLVYGPGSPANPDWGIIRRALDNRPVLLLGDGGRTVRNRGYGPNIALAPLLALDHSDVAAGKIYDVADIEQHTQRQIAEHIAAVVGHEFEIVDIPREIASRIYREKDLDGVGFYAFDTNPIVRDLGYTDAVSVADGLTRSIEWAVANPIERGGEIERQLGDEFHYELEDRIAATYRRALDDALESGLPADGRRAHMYRHPSKPFEEWAAPGGSAIPFGQVDTALDVR